MAIGADLAGQDYCYLTTTGRVSGEAREIEIWFAYSEQGAVVYMLSGGRDRSDWVKNLQREPRVTVRVGSGASGGRARVVDDPDEDALARRLLFEKYSPRYSGDLERWRREALPVAVDLD
jgi:deazaflavin-dependent oxidoreductase (nitroreductase family)